MRLLATIRPETRDPERYQCLRCGIWRVKKSGRSTRYCIDCLSVGNAGQALTAYSTNAANGRRERLWLSPGLGTAQDALDFGDAS